MRLLHYVQFVEKGKRKVYKITIIRNGVSNQVSEMAPEDKVIGKINTYLNVYLSQKYRLIGTANFIVGHFIPYTGYRYILHKRNWLSVLDEIVIQVYILSDQTVAKPKK